MFSFVPFLIMAMRASIMACKFALAIFVGRYLDLPSLGLYGLAAGAVAVAPVVIGMGMVHLLMRDAVTNHLTEVVDALRHYWFFTTAVYSVVLSLVLLGSVTLGWSELWPLVIAVTLFEHVGNDVFHLLSNLQRPLIANASVFVRGAAWALLYVPLAIWNPALRSLPVLFGFWLAGSGLAVLLFIVASWRWPWKDALTRPFRLAWIVTTARRAFVLYLSDLSFIASQYLDRYLVTLFLRTLIRRHLLSLLVGCERREHLRQHGRDATSAPASHQSASPRRRDRTSCTGRKIPSKHRLIVRHARTRDWRRLSNIRSDAGPTAFGKSSCRLLVDHDRYDRTYGCRFRSNGALYCPERPAHDDHQCRVGVRNRSRSGCDAAGRRAIRCWGGHPVHLPHYSALALQTPLPFASADSRRTAGQRMNAIPNRPFVAVIMAAYNADRTLPEAVASVMASTLPVDLFVVDDASRVPAEEVLRSVLGEIPSNIVVVRCAKNMGPSRARNLALHRIAEEGYRYAAVLDADDLADPERFAKQAAYLEVNPGIAAVGTSGQGSRRGQPRRDRSGILPSRESG